MPIPDKRHSTAFSNLRYLDLVISYELRNANALMVFELKKSKKCVR